MELLRLERDLRCVQWQRWEDKLRNAALDEVQRAMYTMNAQRAARAYLAACDAYNSAQGAVPSTHNQGAWLPD